MCASARGGGDVLGALPAFERNPSAAEWQAATEIFEAAFPAWEREPIEDIQIRVAAGHGVVELLKVEECVAGLFVLDRTGGEPFSLLSYLAIHEDLRNRGLGELFCRRAMAVHDTEFGTAMLLLEAEERQARLYGRLGFRRLAVDYEVPMLGSDGAVPMSLMVHEKDNAGRRSFDRATVRGMIHHLLCDAYELAADDPRRVRQMERLAGAGDIAVTAWPPPGAPD